MTQEEMNDLFREQIPYHVFYGVFVGVGIMVIKHFSDPLLQSLGVWDWQLALCVAVGAFFFFRLLHYVEVRIRIKNIIAYEEDSDKRELKNRVEQLERTLHEKETVHNSDGIRRESAVNWLDVLTGEPADILKKPDNDDSSHD
jgi:uncharacterized membrane protein